MPTQLSTATATAINTTQVHVHPQVKVTQVVPQVAVTVPANDMPSMETYRDQQFRDQVVARLRVAEATGQTVQQVAFDMAIEQSALARATKDTALLETAADLLFIAKKTAISDPSIVPTREEARDTMEQIFHRRAEEAQAHATQMTKPAFWNEMLLTAETANSAPFTKATLQQVKLKETYDELLHKDEQGEPQVLAHLDAFRDGMYITHKALAQLFQPNGGLIGPLTDALTKQLPPTHTDRAPSLAASWLIDREAAATVTTGLLANDGDAYKMAVAESRVYHQKKLGLAPIPPAPTHAARAQASKSETGLVMDV